MRLATLISLFLLSLSAHAYIGPGLGLGALGALLGGILTIFLALAGIVWYPLKRMIKKIKRKEPKQIEKRTAADSEKPLEDDAERSHET